MDSLLANLLAAFFGAIIGAWAQNQWQSKQVERSRQLAFIETQLREFYSPVVGRHLYARNLSLLWEREKESVQDTLEAAHGPNPTQIAKDVYWSSIFGQVSSEYFDIKTRAQGDCYTDILRILRDKIHLADNITDEDYRVITVCSEYYEWQKTDISRFDTPNCLRPEKEALEKLLDRFESELKQKQNMLRTGDPMIGTKPKNP